MLLSPEFNPYEEEDRFVVLSLTSVVLSALSCRFIVKDTVEERIVRMRGKKPQDTAAASMLRSRCSLEGLDGSEDGDEDTQSSLLPSVALLRLGQVSG